MLKMRNNEQQELGVNCKLENCRESEMINGAREECCCELLLSTCCVQYMVSDMKNQLLHSAVPHAVCVCVRVCVFLHN